MNTFLLFVLLFFVSFCLGKLVGTVGQRPENQVDGKLLIGVDVNGNPTWDLNLKTDPLTKSQLIINVINTHEGLTASLKLADSQEKQPSL